MDTLRLLIKPASANCNLQCEYCFYSDEAKKREQYSYGLMEISTAEIIIKKAMSETESTIEFGFQGGEPLLAGISFFETFVQLVQKYQTGKIKVFYTIQTNGILLSKEWFEFLKKEKFLVGISLDGTKEIHDRLRKDKEQKGTFLSVMKAIEGLKKYEIPFHVLTVLTGETARRIEKIYRFYTKQGFVNQQYISCLDPFSEERGKERYSLEVKRYEEALKNLFDLWFLDCINGKYCSIRQFENYVVMLRGEQPESCSMSGRCSMQNVIEANGNVYSCDFYSMDQYCLGNIKEKSFGELLECSKAFQEQSFVVKEECKTCKWYPLCRGGCRREREKIDGTIGLNYYCEAYKGFFLYAIERLEYLAKVL